jgi:YVTN family beta-propeller protein
MGLIFVANLAMADLTERVSVDSNGMEGNGESAGCCGFSISADARYVAFSSRATNMVIPDNNGSLADIFIHDRQTGQTVLVSKDDNGTRGNSESLEPSISADGRFIAFSSFATNLVPNDNNSAYDVFVHDRDPDENGIFDEGNETTKMVSVDSGGNQGNGQSTQPSINADGQFIVFKTTSTNLGDPGPFTSKIFVRDQINGQTILMSKNSNGIPANGNSHLWLSSSKPSISDDGRFIVFYSMANNLVSGDLNGADDVFLHDRDSDKNDNFDELGGIRTAIVSVDSHGNRGNNHSFEPAVSGDGRFIAFQSRSGNFGGDTNGAVDDIFVHDRVSGVTEVISMDSSGVQGPFLSRTPSISGNGRFVSFESFNAFVSNDVNGYTDVYVHDRERGETHLVSLDSNGVQGNDHSYRPSVNSDGRLIAFGSSASNLVPGDTNGFSDVFVRTRTLPIQPPGPPPPPGVGYVTNTDSNSVSAFNVFFDQVFKTIPVGFPLDLDEAESGGFLYVNTGLGTVVRIDPRTNRVVSNIILSDVKRDGYNTVDVVIAPNAQRAYVTNYGSHTVSVIDPTTDSVLTDIPVNNPWGAVVLPDSSRVYVGNVFDSNTVTVINALNNQVLKTIPVGIGPCSVMSSPDGSEVWVGNFWSHSISIIDTQTDTVVGTIPNIPSPLDLRFTRDGSRTYVNASGDNTIRVFENGSSIATIPVGPGPRGIELSPDDSKLYVVVSGNNEVAVIDTASLQVIGTIPVGNNPLDIDIRRGTNLPPMADAGPDQTVEATGPDGAPVTLDGTASSDPNGDPLTYEWTGPFGSVSGPNPTITLELGTHPITLTVIDPARAADSDEVEITVVDTTPPSTPSSLTLTVVSSSQINLSWNPSSDLVEIDRYEIERCQGTGCSNFTQIAATVGTDYPDMGLAEGTTYRYRVRAVDTEGNFSGYSNIARANTWKDRLPTSDKKVANAWKWFGCGSGSGSGGGGGKSAYKCVDDPVGSPNNDTDYIEMRNRRDKEAIFGFSNFSIPSGATIQFVRVTYVARATGGTADIQAALRVNGKNYAHSSTQNLSSNWTLYIHDWFVHPGTGNPWTVFDINSPQLEGMGVISGNGEERITQVYITVGYLE